jgi:hypothetical protein
METPIFTIDTDETVEERLTDNVQYKVLPARYLQKDRSGQVVETPRELFERVAQNVAEAEEDYEKGLDAAEAQDRFETVMKELRFVPNSPTHHSVSFSYSNLDNGEIEYHGPIDFIPIHISVSSNESIIVRLLGSDNYKLMHYGENYNGVAPVIFDDIKVKAGGIYPADYDIHINGFKL